MLALVSLFLLTFMIAAAVIWLYRLVFGVQNYEGSTVGKSRARNTIVVNSQKGFLSFLRKPVKPSRTVKSSRTVKASRKLSPASGKNKVPWGW